MSASRLRRALVALAALVLASPAVLEGQDAGRPGGDSAARPDSIRVASGVEPDTVTVGQPYRAIARITVPPRSRVQVSLVPADTEAVEAAGVVRVDTSAAPSGTFVAAVALVAWKTGAGKPVDAVLRVTSPAGASREVSFPFAAPFVRSVLPKDTAGIRPKGPKDVLDAPLSTEHLRRLAALGSIAIALLALLAYLLIRLLVSLRRRREEELADPRERAAAALEHVGAAGLVERGEWKAFYTGVSDAMRDLAAALSPHWGTDLTTAELVERMEDDGVPEGDRETARAILDRADLVKFARHRPSVDAAHADLAAARDWVARIQPPVEMPDEAAAEAPEEAEMAGSAP
jgi:hypothetical protein